MNECTLYIIPGMFIGFSIVGIIGVVCTIMEKEKKPKLSHDELLERNRKLIGKTAVLAISKVVSHVLHGTSYVYEPTKVSSVSGIVTDVGASTIKVGEDWYELDQLRPGGVRIVEII
jgi:hypothetical protein